MKKKRTSKPGVHEHLAESLKLTYSQRLEWLRQAQDFVRLLPKQKLKSAGH